MRGGTINDNFAQDCLDYRQLPRLPTFDRQIRAKRAKTGMIAPRKMGKIYQKQ